MMNQQKKVLIKSVEIEGQEKLKAHQESKIERSKINYKERVEVEKSEISKRQAELHELEQLESELIAKLKHTQTVQQDAFKELKSALESPGKPQ